VFGVVVCVGAWGEWTPGFVRRFKRANTGVSPLPLRLRSGSGRNDRFVVVRGEGIPQRLKPDLWWGYETRG